MPILGDQFAADLVADQAELDEIQAPSVQTALMPGPTRQRLSAAPQLAATP